MDEGSLQDIHVHVKILIWFDSMVTCILELTLWGLNKIAVILLEMCSSAFSEMNNI